MTNTGAVISPEPFRNESFSLLRHGIYDDPALDVYINAQRDFAFLDPLPQTVYTHYQPRVEALDLAKYKAKLDVFLLRFGKIQEAISGAGKLLEIGAADAGFLAFVHERLADMDLACVEPDAGTKSLRDQYHWLRQFESITEAANYSWDVVAFFHVFEHIIDPVEFLSACVGLLSPGGIIVLEVPALSDPLLSLYRVPAYEDFFFQKQHPYYYSAQSLHRLLEKNDYEVKAMIPHQRYGLENHLAWMRHGKPGGDAIYQEIFSTTEASYRKSLETSGHTDSIIAIAKPRS